MLVMTILSWLVTLVVLGVVGNFIGRELLEGKTGADHPGLTFISISYPHWPYCSGWLWKNRSWSWVYPWAFLVFFYEWIRFGGRKAIKHPGFSNQLQVLMREPVLGSVVRNGRLSGEMGRCYSMGDWVEKLEREDAIAAKLWKIAHNAPGGGVFEKYAIRVDPEPIVDPNLPPWLRQQRMEEYLLCGHTDVKSIAEIECMKPIQKVVEEPLAVSVEVGEAIFVEVVEPLVVEPPADPQPLDSHH